MKIKAGTVDKDTRMYTVTGLFVDQMYTFCIETIVGVEYPAIVTSEPVEISESTGE